MTSPSSTVPTQSTGEGRGALLVYISAGVSGAVVVLVAAAVTVISVSVCLRKRKNKHVNTTDNVAYHCSSSGPETMKIKKGSLDAVSQINNAELLTSVNDAYLAVHEYELNEEHVYETIPATMAVCSYTAT